MLEQVQVRNLAFGEGAYRIGTYSGLITGVTTGSATNGHLWACRWAPGAAPSLLDKRTLAVISRIRVRAFTITGYTAAQEVLLTLFKLTSYTAAHTGGIAVTPSEKRTATASPIMTARIANTAQLTAGTHTLDTDSFAAGAYAELATAATVQKGAIDILVTTDDLKGDPFILANNEGILLRNEIAQGAGGTMRLCVEMDWLEVERY